MSSKARTRGRSSSELGAPSAAPSARSLEALDTLAGWYRDLVVVSAGASAAVSVDRLAELEADGDSSRGPTAERGGRDGLRRLALLRVQRPAEPRARGARSPPARSANSARVPA